MNPFYWRGTTNFGDYMNHWLWPKLIPDLLDPQDDIRLVGIGSLLKSELNYVKGKKVIFGTGSGYGDIPPQSAIDDWYFYFVRGPLTASKFALSPEKAIVDGAWLISKVPGFSSIPQKKGVSFVPHWRTAVIGNWESVCLQAGITYIDPLGDFEQVIQGIAESELVIAESLHAAILADYYRTPWIPVQISPSFLNFKWHDWCQSVGLEFKSVILPPSDFFECIYNRNNPFTLNLQLQCMQSPQFNNLAIKKVQPSFPIVYKQKVRVKSVLKSMREKALLKIKGKRNMAIFRPWNEKHCRELSKLLNMVKGVEPLMSHDSIREQKIEKLDVVLETLIRDYKDGMFVD